MAASDTVDRGPLRAIQAALGGGLRPGEVGAVHARAGVGKSSLLRGLAGLWDSGNGTIIHPELGEMMFLPQTPYMLLGTLREQFTYPNATATEPAHDDGDNDSLPPLESVPPTTSFCLSL